jgi:hypothetical protein
LEEAEAGAVAAVVATDAAAAVNRYHCIQIIP